MAEMSSPLRIQNRRKWHFTWESLAHTPILKLFLFSPGHRPLDRCKNLKSSISFQAYLLSIFWTEDETLKFRIGVPVPSVLIDPCSTVEARALEDHIEVRVSLILPVDHPLNVGDFDSIIGSGEEGVDPMMGAMDRLMSLSLDSDIKALSLTGGVHFYCKSCSSRLTRIPLRSFLEIPSVDWRDVADNWFGACCCSFGGISEKLVEEYISSYACVSGTCFLDDSSVIVCKDDLDGSFSECFDNNLPDLKFDNGVRSDSANVPDSSTNGRENFSSKCGSDGIELKLDSINLEEQHIALDLMNYDSHCLIDENVCCPSHACETSTNGFSITTLKKQELTKHAKLLPNQKRFHNGAGWGGFMVRSNDISTDVEWVEFSCSHCSSLLGSFPSVEGRRTPLDDGVRLFKCYISTSLPVGGSADLFRRHTLQRVFINRLLESTVDELSFRTIVKDLKDYSPLLQIVVLNPKAWHFTGSCFEGENEAGAFPRIALYPIVKVLFSDASTADKRKVEEWVNKVDAAEVYMMKRQVEVLIDSLKSAQERLPASCACEKILSLSSLER